MILENKVKKGYCMCSSIFSVVDKKGVIQLEMGFTKMIYHSSDKYIEFNNERGEPIKYLPIGRYKIPAPILADMELEPGDYVWLLSIEGSYGLMCQKALVCQECQSLELKDSCTTTEKGVLCYLCQQKKERQ